MANKIKNMFRRERKYLNDGKSGIEAYHVQQKEAQQQKRNFILYCENVRQFSR
ncbi:hypothetical protein JNUCC1_00520 [Lentibacillus sp. JNUCC-1]|uniref:hypothetical protein n=1 Tax=Lentibacillus sp. JNUCC-1 TaxID=2654513 RepID=UPI0012E7C30D|nr:hypothetical protein [Lentibacillus sp. JNUCC-1]MUV36716.1 hypothetical protein [Lentibacillus sp. JNUCC-1]